MTTTATTPTDTFMTPRNVIKLIFPVLCLLIFVRIAEVPALHVSPDIIHLLGFFAHPPEKVHSRLGLLG